MSQIESAQSTSMTLRPPETVMQLERMGCAHQSRLSFMRVLLRNMQAENWRFERPLWDIDNNGVGRAVYSAIGPDRIYSLVAFAHDLPDEMRSDRVIATAWDATFTLFDGVPNDADLDRLQDNVPKQEAGRVSDSELSLSRANRSVRMWDYVVDKLASGQQPEADWIDSVGYLMRTTAVYGSGKFGAADRAKILDRDWIAGPFRLEMLAVFLIREFTLSLCEHMAHVKGGDKAVNLKPHLRNRFGVGNSTGLGMAPFLINHPSLLNNWMMARETALARVRAVEKIDLSKFKTFKTLLIASVQNAKMWSSEHSIQQIKLASLRADLEKLTAHVDGFTHAPNNFWDHIYQWSESELSLEGQEQLVSLLMEPYPELVDGLANCMTANEEYCFAINGAMRVSELLELIKRHYAWAAYLDSSERDQLTKFWYISQEKLEPRLGNRFEEPGEEYELPFGFGHDMLAMAKELAEWPSDTRLAEVLLQRPEYRHLVRRAQLLRNHPYAEIQSNLLANDMLPIDILRCKLAFFGATRFDPRSDRWVRICMYQGAPSPFELNSSNCDTWSYPMPQTEVGNG